MLAQKEGYLRERHVAVYLARGRERGGVNALKGFLRTGEPAVFFGERRGRVVAESPVHVLQRGVEPRAAEVCVDRRIAAEKLDDVLVVNRLKRRVAAAARRCRSRGAVLCLLLLHARAGQEGGQEQEECSSHLFFSRVWLVRALSGESLLAYERRLTPRRCRPQPWARLFGLSPIRYTGRDFHPNPNEWKAFDERTEGAALGRLERAGVRRRGAQLRGGRR